MLVPTEHHHSPPNQFWAAEAPWTSLPAWSSGWWQGPYWNIKHQLVFQLYKMGHKIQHISKISEGEKGNKVPFDQWMFLCHHQIWLNVPAIHIKVHSLCFLKLPKVSYYLRLFHGIALQFLQPFDKLNARVVFAVDKGLFSHLQIKFVECCLSQKMPVKFTGERGLIASIYKPCFYKNP